MTPIIPVKFALFGTVPEERIWLAPEAIESVQEVKPTVDKRTHRTRVVTRSGQAYDVKDSAEWHQGTIWANNLPRLNDLNYLVQLEDHKVAAGQALDEAFSLRR